MYGLKSAVLTSFLTLSVAVSATPVTVDLDYTGFTQGYKNGIIYDYSVGEHASAGQFGFDVSNVQGLSPFDLGSSISTFCVQIDALLDTTNTRTYELVDAASYFGNASLIDNIGALYTSHYNDIHSARTSTAFQLALWELVNEDSGSTDLKTGNFEAVQFGSADTLADSWMSSLTTGADSDFDLYVLRADNTQDQLVATPRIPPSDVPEPGTLALFGLVLAVFGIQRARKSTEAKSA